MRSILFEYSYMVLYTITLIVGVFYYGKYKNYIWLRLWMYFLIYSLFTEIIGYYFVNIKGLRFNLSNNLWGVISVLFYLGFFLSKLKLRKTRTLVKVLLLFFGIYSLIDFTFFNSLIYDLPSRGIILGSLFVVATFFVYLAELLKSDAIFTFQKSLFFWITIGVLIFYLGLLPVLVIAEMIVWQGIFKYIVLALNFSMNLCFIIGFVVSKKEFNN